jgi:hypothetical protein
MARTRSTFTEGKGPLGKAYERLRKRSWRATHMGVGGRGVVLGRSTYVGYWWADQHQAYVRGLHDGILAALETKVVE